MKIAISCLLFGEKAGGAKHLANFIKEIELKLDDSNVYYFILNKTLVNHMKSNSKRIHFIYPGKVVDTSVSGIMYRSLILPFVLKKRAFDLYVDFFNPIVFFSLIRTICVVRDLAEMRYGNKYDRIRMLYRRCIMLPLTLKRSDGIISISKSTKEDIVDFFKIDPTKIRVIYHGIDLTFNGGQINMDVCKEHGLAVKRFFISVGRLDPIGKNLVNLIRAFSLFKQKKQSDYKLVLVGAPWRKSDILFDEIDRSTSREDIIITGYVNETQLKSYYSMAKALVFPSIYEGFGHPILEAMSSGLPVCCSNVSSLPDVGGEAALYFDPFDVQDIAMKMETITNDEAVVQNLIRAGFENIKRFSWKRHFAEYLEYFEYIASR